VVAAAGVGAATFLRVCRPNEAAPRSGPQHQEHAPRQRHRNLLSGIVRLREQIVRDTAPLHRSDNPIDKHANRSPHCEVISLSGSA
jgi:hypothetical protein